MGWSLPFFSSGDGRFDEDVGVSFTASYRLLDVAPKGRAEEELAYPMAWVRRYDAYAIATG
jgi:predicted dithiol-disulfide oxidoreductase (DUF899 family)